MKPWLKLLISIAIPLAVGGIAGFFTNAEINGWYQSIEKPNWQPPGWVFGPVWTLLYILMGIALFLVWNSRGEEKEKRTAFVFWGIQMVLNFLWSFIFFRMHEIGWALTEIIVLWISILLTIFSFARISRVAAWLLVPYISWVSFAALLTFTIWQLN